MKNTEYIREKAVKLRENGYSLPDICERLNRPKTTVYYWIKDVEIKKMNMFLRRKKQNVSLACQRAGRSSRKRFKALHDKSRLEAEQAWNDGLKNNELFKMFIMAYCCEGTRRGKHSVGISRN